MVSLTVTCTNIEAIRLYESVGFRSTPPSRPWSGRTSEFAYSPLELTLCRRLVRPDPAFDNFCLEVVLRSNRRACDPA